VLGWDTDTLQVSTVATAGDVRLGSFDLGSFDTGMLCFHSSNSSCQHPRSAMDRPFGFDRLPAQEMGAFWWQVAERGQNWPPELTDFWGS